MEATRPPFIYTKENTTEARKIKTRLPLNPPHTCPKVKSAEENNKAFNVECF
jgi:hypothetical protein